MKRSFLNACLFVHVFSGFAQDKPLTLFKETYTVPSLPKFSYIVCSDPQLPWTRSNEKKKDGNYPGDDIMWKRSISRLNNCVSAINSIQKKTNTIRGIIINGDLTKGGSKVQLDGYKKAFDGLERNIKLYPGLGNHDFNNDSQENKVRMVRYLFETVSNELKIEECVDDYNSNALSSSFDAEESFAYSWDEGPIHFVQLNNYPSYTDEISYDGETTKITSSLPWLESDLRNAKARGQYIILNFHMWGDKFIAFLDDEFVKIMQKYRPIAAFTGHVHSNFGTVFVDPTLVDKFPFPIFQSGSVFNDNFFLVDFYDKNWIIRKYMSTNGVATQVIQPNGREDSWIFPYPY